MLQNKEDKKGDSLRNYKYFHQYILCRLECCFDFAIMHLQYILQNELSLKIDCNR